jgi:DNA-binding GntR family transcriptional regulator
MGINALGQIRRQRAADSVCELLRQAILEGVFLPGERLDVKALAKEFDVSATPVKNAIHMLATAGLIDIKPRSGTFVAGLSATDIAETFDIRRALECLAVETAVSNVTNAALDHLSQLIEKMKAPVSVEQHSRDNTEFHRTLVGLSGNRKLLAVYDGLNAHIRIARIHRSRGNWQLRVGDEQAEHAEIFRALQSRNARELANAVAKHIDRAKAALIESLT